MEAKLYGDIQINRKNLEITDNLINALNAYRDRLIDSDMPYLMDAPGIDEEIDYYDKVEKFINNELKRQLLNNI
jgi:hypothetical protein